MTRITSTLRAAIAGGVFFFMAGQAVAQPWDHEPGGSYRATCRNEDVDRGTLRAECRDRMGRYHRTQLANYRSCDGDIWNDNGQLRCRRDRDDWGGGDGPWGGDRRITLYKDAGFRGASRTFDRNVPDLRAYGFANTVSSANVRGNGIWQFCDQPFYRGRCITVRGDVRNFDGSGLNDKIESIRRIRG